MNEDHAWFAQADLREYEGEYVAICSREVVAHGDDPERIYEKAKALRPGKKVILWKVMRQGTYVFPTLAPDAR